MASLRQMRGKWYARVQYRKNGKAKEKLIPLRTSEKKPAIRRKLEVEKYEKDNFDVVVTVTKAHRSSYFNMVKIDDSGRASLVNDIGNKITRRQDAPAEYDMTTVAYVVNPLFVIEKNNMFEGRVGCVHIPVERSLDIDTMLDFKIAEYLINERE